MPRGTAMRVWVVDPISYTGMAYTDVAQVLALRDAGADALLAGADDWMLDRDIVPRKAVYRGTSGNAPRLRRGFAYLLSSARLVRAVWRARPEILHWQYTELPLIDTLAVAAIRLTGVRQVYTAHELLPWTARSYHRLLFRAMYHLLDGIVVHDEERSRELTSRYGLAAAKVHVVPLGDYARYAAPGLTQDEARSHLGLPPDVPVALFFGTIRPSKGLEVLAQAWPTVATAVPEAILVIAGKPYKGMDRAAIEAQVQSGRAAGHVRTDLRQVSPAETNDYYRASDVVVLPYHAIGTSGVLRYAYNSLRPVVATAVGEHVRHVLPGATGYLVPPGEARALADALIAALEDRPHLEQLGRQAGAYCDAAFGWDGIARRLVDIYAELVEIAGRQPRQAR